MSAYFQPQESAAVRAAQLAWWADELEDWSHEQVVWALRKWNREEPRNRPTPGDIVALLKAERGRRWAAGLAPRPEPARKPVTAERAAEILAKAGLAERFASRRAAE